MQLVVWKEWRPTRITEPMASATTNPAIGKKLKALRKHLGLSQELFAEQLGVSQGTLSRYEKGEMPKRTLWGKIAAAARTTPAEFFYDATNGGLRPDDVRELVTSALLLAGMDQIGARSLADRVIEACVARLVRAAGDTSVDAEFQLEFQDQQSSDQ